MVDHEHILDLLPAYALGCLEGQEKASADQHLASCELCRAELQAYRAVTDRLGFAAPDALPPAMLKEKVMERALSNRRLNFSPREAKPVLGFFKSYSLTWGIASLAIILVLIVSNLALWRQVTQLQETNRLLQEAVHTDFRTVTMVGTSSAPLASGLIVISPDGKHGTLVVEQLPALDPDHQYQLWLIDEDGKRASGGVFSVSEDGYGSLWVDAPELLSSYPSFGITIEPAGGSPGPTGEKVLGSEG